MQYRDPLAKSKAGKLELLPLPPDRALALLSHAAERGNADAALMLATIHERGAGVARDLVASAQWLHRAAELDYDFTVRQLGKRCGDLLQHLLSLCDQVLQERDAELRRTIEALADSTHDLQMVACAAAGSTEDEQRDSA